MNKEELLKKYGDGTLLMVTKGTESGLYPMQQVILGEAKSRQEEIDEAVRDAYRKGYFDSGVRPTEDEVKKFQFCYTVYLKTLKGEEDE